MIPVDEARQRILGGVNRLAAEQVAISEAAGRVLAQSVVSRITKPPHPVSAMDGYAVRAADVAAVPATLDVVGEAPAGGSYDKALEPGQAVRIFTGGPVPNGADTIIIQENTTRDSAVVTVQKSAAEGTYVRRKGLDFAEGDAGPQAGCLLGPREIGLIAAMNVPWLKVTRRPRIAILGTGDEIVMPGEPLGLNQIVSSNSLSLAAIARDAGAEPINLGIAPDNEDALRSMVSGAKRADMLVVTGGMSVGEHDLVRKVLADEGLDLDFWKIAMRPGKPLAFGVLGDTPMLGFPGNPVSTMVCGHLFLRACIGKMLGLPPDDGEETATLGADLGANDERQDYMRASLDRDAQGHLVATPFNRQDSSMLATLALSSCLIIRPPHAEPARSGDLVSVIRL
ncbi:MAG: molybdopterin molybdenumtransferase MoeA [Rhodospirillaceae bacterium]|nr:molybdopterin molybdenumtransferase MoeA [Rhodospirillaceae bacterium]|tara:strand:- start:9573 stop:10763 length:1191 start_codon:yes stop_codon:yes gene_type:complete